MEKIVALYPGLETTQIIELSLTLACSELSQGVQSHLKPISFGKQGPERKKTKVTLKWFSFVSWCHRQGHEKGSDSPREMQGGWDGQRRAEQCLHWQSTVL